MTRDDDDVRTTDEALRSLRILSFEYGTLVYHNARAARDSILPCLKEQSRFIRFPGIAITPAEGHLAQTAAKDAPYMSLPFA
jgi:hypothetical protein